MCFLKHRGVIVKMKDEYRLRHFGLNVRRRCFVPENGTLESCNLFVVDFDFPICYYSSNFYI